MINWDFQYENSDLEAVVDYYTVFITPAPLSNPISNVLRSPPWNVTLAHNTPYNLSLTATNCAGDSETTFFPDEILFGEYNFNILHILLLLQLKFS